MSECKWDSSKHNGKPCPFHVGETLEEVKNTNPYVESKTNCIPCTIAYELKKRGIKAIPKKAFSGYFQNFFKNQEIEPIQDFFTKDNIIPELLKLANSYEEDVRIQVVVRWENRDYGHSFILEKDKGIISFLNPQKNDEMYKGWEKDIDPSLVFLSRIDNLEIDEEKIKELFEDDNN